MSISSLSFGKRFAVVFLVVSLLSVIVAGPALAAYFVGTRGADDLRGTNHSDEMYGLRGADDIKGKDGDDYIEGGTGPDHLYGMNNADEIYGGKGDDRMFGGDGNDYLNSADDASDAKVDCGGGMNDKYTADLVDTVVNCETPVPTFP
jgi:Ca2+-binding RTX toxin-like protein